MNKPHENYVPFMNKWLYFMPKIEKFRLFSEKHKIIVDIMILVVYTVLRINVLYVKEDHV